jgi:hypothetical protein
MGSVKLGSVAARPADAVGHGLSGAPARSPGYAGSAARLLTVFLRAVDSAALTSGKGRPGKP